MLNAANTRRWALPAVIIGVVATAAVEFFWYPLDADLFILGWAIGACVWVLALAAALTATLATFLYRGGGNAALLALVAVAGLAAVVRMDLDVAYPRAYHLVYRSDFAAAAARGETVRWMSNSSGYGYGYAHLPTASRGQELTLDGTVVTAAVALGDGWWFVQS